MPTASSSRAFTLFELLLVIVLIAALYGVFVHKLSTASKPEHESLTLRTLKSFLQSFEFRQSAELLCLEPCTGCRVVLDGKTVEMPEIPLFKRAPKVYEKDRFGQYRPFEFLPMQSETGTLKDVCFRFRVYPNGSGSSFALYDGERYYRFDPYFDRVSEAASLSDIDATLDKDKLLPTERRSYNF